MWQSIQFGDKSEDFDPRCAKQFCTAQGWSEWVTPAGYRTGIYACGTHSGYNDDPFKVEL